MSVRTDKDVIRRCVGNPLIALADLPFQCSDIRNAGVARFGNEFLLLVTVESLQGRCSLYLARSRDGERFSIDAKPFMAGDTGPLAQYENMGIRDPRITFLDDTYYIVYVAEGLAGLRLALARTDDFVTVERMVMLTQPDTKNGVLFPVKFGGKYALLERPNPGNSIWLSFSADLTFWGNPKVVMTPRSRYWDSDRIGAAGVPIEIDCGWLLIYYGEKITSAGPLLRLGAAVLDRDEPWKVLARSNIPILSPRERYERIGDVCNVVFSCGTHVTGGDLRVYYGASDSCICLGTARIDDVVRICYDSSREF